MLIDCDYVVESLIAFMKIELEVYKPLISWQQYFELEAFIYYLNERAKAQNISFCSLAFELIGVLDD